MSAATVAHAEPDSPPAVAVEGTDTTADKSATEDSSSTASIVLGVVGGLAARDLLATGIRYHDEIAATGQYPIAATYTSSAASQAFALSAMPIVNLQGFWYYLNNILPLG